MVLTGALALTLGLLPNAIVLATGAFVEAVPASVAGGLDSPAGRQAVLALILVAAGFAASGCLMALARLATELLNTRYVLAVADTVGRASLAPRGIADLEDADVAGDIGGLSDFERSGLHMQTALSLRMVVSRRTSGLGAAAILVTLAWWAPLVLAAGWYVANAGSSRWMERGFTVARAEGGGRLRRADYVRGLAVAAPAAKEIRVFGLAGWVVEQYTRTWLDAMAAVWGARRSNLRQLAFGVAGVMISHGAVFGLLAWQTSQGRVSIGALAVYGMAILGTAELGFLGDPQWRVGRAAALAQQVLDLEARLAPAGGERTGRPTGSSGAGPHPAEPPPSTDSPRPAEVSLEGVSFTYRGRDTPTLHGLDLRIPPGQALAVVGENGAGKTTLIKLICGLYEPPAGRVRLDGRDLRAADLSEIRRRVGVIFQDFVRYELPLRENVGFGRLPLLGDDAELEGALRDAGGGELLQGLPAGWDTMLARGYDGGVDLSGGQWRKVALARALAAVHGGAGLLILDEPTANLDVRAEVELFDRFLALTRGITTILVTHRLSSVRHADRIVVLAGGRVVEDGSHEELMTLGGRYARMFSLQAERFAPSADPSADGATHA